MRECYPTPALLPHAHRPPDPKGPPPRPLWPLRTNAKYRRQADEMAPHCPLDQTAGAPCDKSDPQSASDSPETPSASASNGSPASTSTSPHAPPCPSLLPGPRHFQQAARYARQGYPRRWYLPRTSSHSRLISPMHSLTHGACLPHAPDAKAARPSPQNARPNPPSPSAVNPQTFVSRPCPKPLESARRRPRSNALGGLAETQQFPPSRLSKTPEAYLNPMQLLPKTCCVTNR